MSKDNHNQEMTPTDQTYLIISKLLRSKVNKMDQKLKKMGVMYDLHQFIHSNATQTLYIEIDLLKLDRTEKHVSEFLG